MRLSIVRRNRQTHREMLQGEGEQETCPVLRRRLEAVKTIRMVSKVLIMLLFRQCGLGVTAVQQTTVAMPPAGSRVCTDFRSVQNFGMLGLFLRK